MSFGVYGLPAQAMQDLDRQFREGRIGEAGYRSCMAILKALHDLQVPPHSLNVSSVNLTGEGRPGQSDWFRLQVDGSAPA